MEVAARLAVGRRPNHADPRRSTAAKLWIASYDVSNDRARSHLASRLAAYGYRSQYSVFELELNVASASGIIGGGAALLKPLDSFLLLPVCPQCTVARKGRPYPGSNNRNWNIV